MGSFSRHDAAASATAKASPNKEVVIFPVPLCQRFIARELALHGLKYVVCDDRGDAHLHPLVSGPIRAASLSGRFLLVVIYSPDVALIA